MYTFLDIKGQIEAQYTYQVKWLKILTALHLWKFLHLCQQACGFKRIHSLAKAFATASDNLAIALRRPKEMGGFGIPERDRVLLVYPPSLDFLVAFIACLKANLVAVPVFPPGTRPSLSIHDFWHMVSIQLWSPHPSDMQILFHSAHVLMSQCTSKFSRRSAYAHTQTQAVCTRPYTCSRP